MESSQIRMHAAQILPVAILAIVPLTALVFSSEYLLFHTLAELFVCAVALVIFSIAWHTRRIATNDYLTFVGMASLPFALVILLHALSYEGMPTFPYHDADLPTQLWLIARVMQASAFVIAPWYITRRLVHPGRVLLAYAIVATVLTTAAVSNAFPAAFIEGQGLTPFKIWTEIAVIAAMVASALGLWRYRRHVDQYVAAMLWFAMACIAIAELSFTLYTDPYGMWNRIGHVLHVAASIGIYAALVQSSLEEPLSTVFRQLKQSEVRLADAYKQEHDIAETLQSGMAVQPMHIQGLDLAYRYLPATGVGRIGGDFYDVFPIEGSLVGFLIGDVCGKGVRAASISFQVRSVVHAFALSNPDPTSVLESANHYLIRELDDDMFVTAVYGTIDTASGETRYAVAGHLDPVVCGRCEPHDDGSGHAMPLGVLEPFDVITQTIKLESGEGLVLITDGVTEARGTDGLYGADRVCELLNRVGCDQGAEGLLRSLLESVQAFAGSTRNQDDIAMVAIRFTP